MTAAAARVLVLGLGGTIAVAGPGGVPTLSARELTEAVPGLAGTGIEVEAVSLRALPGSALSLADLAELVAVAAATSADGVVVTQGTDTIEETAYAIDLLHNEPRPIVITGAMRQPWWAGADGPANLLAAIRVAASPRAGGLGCLVVMADEIHAAARVRKTHTTSPAAFASPNGGPLGHLVEGEVHLLHRPATRISLPPLPPVVRAPRVALAVACLAGEPPVLADDVEGLVVAGFGAGHVPETWVAPLHEAARRIPVVLASRTGAGFVATDSYGFPGSERDLIEHGLLPAGPLDAFKARILLQILILQGATRADVAAVFGAGAAGERGAGG